MIYLQKQNDQDTPISDKLYIGWKEWCQLPDLGIPAIKAKIDTGAKTSALHAFDIHAIKKNELSYARFKLYPLQADSTIFRQCEALILDQRPVMSSNGQIEQRYVIATTMVLGSRSWTIEVTLSNRDPLKFRMLLGREALNGRVLIDPNHCYCQGKIKKSALKVLY